MLDSTPLFYIGQGGLATKTVAGNRTSKYKFCRTEKKNLSNSSPNESIVIEGGLWVDRQRKRTLRARNLF
jgi:hypothetical protein